MDVIFHEESQWNRETHHSDRPMIHVDIEAEDPTSNCSAGGENNWREASSKARPLRRAPVSEDMGTHVAPTDGSLVRKTRLLSDIYSTCTFAMNVADLIDFKEAMKNKKSQEAMDEEMMSIEDNNTWEICN